jgi:DNA-binding LacI/PurR family transcriptional regulator
LGSASITKGTVVSNKVTLSTIALELGVSTATASLALRDSPLVAEKTRERIKEKALASGYIYNRRAASLRTSKSDIVGVIVRDIINPFFAEILHSIEDELGLSRQQFLLCNHGDNLELQNNFIGTLMQFGADGVIISPSIGTTVEDIKMMEQNGLLVSMVARGVEGTDIPTYLGDDRAGFRMVTEHLIELGHRNIAIVGGSTKTSTGRERRAGFEDAFREANLEITNVTDIETPYDRKAGYQAVSEILKLKHPPTAIACASDTVAIGVINGLRHHGLEAGRDISVTGYDDIDEAVISSPALTTVADGHREIGKRAARALIARVKGEPVEEGSRMIKPQLKIRQSTTLAAQ